MTSSQLACQLSWQSTATVSQRSWVQIPFFRPYFNCCSSSIRYCQDCFHIHSSHTIRQHCGTSHSLLIDNGTYSLSRLSRQTWWSLTTRGSLNKNTNRSDLTKQVVAMIHHIHHLKKCHKTLLIRYFEYSNYTLNRKSIFLTEYIPGTLVHQSVLFLRVHLAFPVLEK